MKFTILVHPFFVIINIYLVCLIHAPEGHEIYYLVDSSLVIIKYKLNLSDLCLGVERYM